MDRLSPAEILADALELAPQERNAFLETRCAGDAALLAEVRSLLDAYSRAHGLLPSDWLRRAAPDIAGTHEELSRISPEKDLGRQIGAYRLQRLLGAGGMGAVYLADRSDSEFVKQVAIKLVRPGMWTEEVLQRFWTERQVLANLEHQNIARLLDGGATDDGLPYLVMEYVDGAPIDVYADEQRLSVAERLRLFVQVCDAVAFAHRNLIVHRDLKPGNVLVDRRGIPKLLDFGIAKILDPGGSAEVGLTRTGMRPLTPEYASPEQVRGEPVTTAADVYSLGILLYELLTGRRPYEINSRSSTDLEKAICETEPAAPSTIVTHGGAKTEQRGENRDAESLARARGTEPGRLRRQLEGDLDNIVLMALRKEPERRYPSVERLADDIHRHLDGLPVAAQKDTWRYRSAKFARRNKLAVGAASSIFALITVFAVAMTLQAGRLARERDRARRETESSRRVAQFLTDLFTVSKPEESRGNTVTARELLEAGTQKIQEGLEDDPAVRAELLRTMGNTYQSLGLYAPACSLLVEATEMETALYGPDDNEHLATALADLAIVYRNLGRLDEARALYERVLGIRTAALPPDHVDMAVLHNNYGTALFDAGDYSGARKEFEQAIAIWDKALGPDNLESPSPLRSLAHVALQDSDFDGAEKYAKRSLEVNESQLGADHPEAIRSLIALGIVYGTMSNNEATARIMEKALPLAERVFGPDHEQTALVINTLAAAYDGLGDKERARDLFMRALVLRRAILGPRHSSVANTVYRLAAIEAGLGETDSARVHFREATSILEEAVGPNHPNLSYTYIQHANLLVTLHEYAGADSLYALAGGILERNFGPNHPRMVRFLLARGEFERSRHRYPAADSLLGRAFQICADSLAADHRDAVATRRDYARLLREMGEETRAAALEQ
jgi:eukaryotic-like serine/threonine-protein kinase